MEKAFQTICALVKDFKANEKAYLSQLYQESQVRQDFIDKFFTALGWDVTHTVQKNPYEQEVKIENKVTTQGSQRRADYAFFVTPNYRDVKFFAEAKKPAHNLSNPDYYHQTIRYGWNAGTPIAILTDFEEFHVLDCRYKPDIGDALNRKLKYFHYSEYTDEEKFKKIFYLFGRDAVANGSLEKYAADLPKPRGKAIQGGLFKGGYKSVDEDFLELLDEYRNVLAKAFKKENQELDGEELTEAVQRTIDRLVFIRFLEDKGIEEPEIIGLHEKPSAWKGFIALCKRLEPKYNGLIFKPHRILDGKDFQAPEDKAFADICAELSDPSSPYDFDKIPISILGSIYERFLGKVVHSTDKRVKVEEKPEVRKAGGVYYTPEYIVRYIVSETVGKLLYGDSPVILNPPVADEESIQAKQDSSPRFSGTQNDKKWKTPETVSTMSFADIACGSGSFLIEVYSQLLEYHERWYNANPDKAKKEDVFERDGHLQLTLKKKKEILLNNVYGVDIDFQATEVTQLSLYLKLLENVTSYETHQLGMFKEQILPNLNSNIVCGNSLIGTDIYDGDLFASQAPIRTPHIHPSNEGGSKGGLTTDADKLKPMNFEDVFPQIIKKGGFDAVVGNPPYRIIAKDDIEYNYSKYLEKKYSSYQYKVDLYHLFIERAIKALKSGGTLGYITPNTWYTLQYTINLREFVLTNSELQKLLIFSHKVFGDANVDTAITILKRCENKKLKDNVFVWTFPKEFNPELIYASDPELFDQGKWSEASLFRFETRIPNNLGTLLDKIKANSKQLSEIARASLGTQAYNSSKHTKEQITKRVFHSTKKLSKEYLPELSGNDVGRYSLQWQKKEYIKGVQT